MNYYYFTDSKGDGKKGKPENNNGNYSRLFQDLMNLERDYSFTQNLVKMKTEEVERCNLANEKLQEIIKEKMSEIQELQCENFKLRSDLVQAENEAKNQKILHEKRLKQFEEELDASNKRYESLVQQHKIDLIKKESEIRQNLDSVTKEKEIQYEKSIVQLEEKIRLEKQMGVKLSESLKKQIDESLQIKNRLRKTEETYLCEKTALEQELNSLKPLCSKLAAEIEFSKQINLRLESELSRSTSEIKKYQDDLKLFNQDTKTMNAKFKNLNLENESLKQKVREASQVYGNAIQDAREWKKKYEELKIKMEIQGNGGICSDTSHLKFDVLQKQNCILQDVVKTLRKEREEADIKNQKDITDAEGRIERLEAVVDFLKESCNFTEEENCYQDVYNEDIDEFN